MRNFLLLTLSAALLIFSAETYASTNLKKLPTKSKSAASLLAKVKGNENYGPTASKGSYPKAPLSALVAVPNATLSGVSGYFDLQSNGRGLHNVQIDPDDAQKIHAIVMTDTSSDFSETDQSAYPSRRVMYTFSSDGGSTWTPGKSISTVRTGYPDMVLYKRNGVYVPIIAAHRYVSGSAAPFVSAIYIEQGAPGAGNFKEVLASRKTSDGTQKDMLWPTIALSKDQTKVYMLGDFSDPNPSKVPGISPTYDYMEFGSFTLSVEGTSATWDGWKSRPGAGGAEKGYSSVGKHVIRVSENGTIGVLWINPSQGDADHSLYFVESADGGTTWPTTFDPLMPSTLDADNARGIAPDVGIDFFYSGNKPHFVWQASNLILGKPDSSTYYFPYTGQLFYYNPDLANVLCLNYYERVYEITSVKVLGQDKGLSYLYQSTDYTANIPSGIQFPSPSTISNTVFAPTNDPNVFAIFYQTVKDDDIGDVEGVTDGQTYTEWFGNIYYQYTLDGGNTWTEPRPYRTNDVSSSDPHTDFRFPEASFQNKSDVSGMSLKILFAADSLPGQFDQTSGAGYDLTGWYYQNYQFSSVRASKTPPFGAIRNYPNPVISGNATTISFALDNTSDVTLVVTDMLGRRVARVSEGKLSGGSHEISFSTKDLAPGVYNYSIRAGADVAYGAMNVIR